MDDLIRVFPDGSRVQYRGKQLFFYVPTPAVAVLADATPTVGQQVLIQSDSDFELLEITHTTDDGAGAIVEDPLITLLLQQSGSGIDFMAQPLPLPAITGDGQLPFILPCTRIWPANSQMAVTLNRYAPAGTDYNTRLVFIGQKLFR